MKPCAARASASEKEEALYDDVVMDHIKNARNYRVLEDADRRVEGSNPMCGDELQLYLALEGGRIADIAFQCTCCGISMASASVMTESMAGRSAKEALEAIRAFATQLRTPSAVPPAAGNAGQQAVLDAVRRFPARRRCALLPWITLEAALEGREQASF